MLDKAKLTSKFEIEPKQVHATAKKLYRFEVNLLDRHYLYCRKYSSSSGQVMTVKTSPKQTNISPISIELNPSHFSGLNELSLTLSELIPLEHLRFSRIDYSSDIPISFSDLWRQADVKYKVMRDRYRGSETTGLYFGCHNHIVKIYDKAKESNLGHPLTRVEVLQKHKSVSVVNFLDLHKLSDFDPFENVRFMSLRLPDNYGSPKSYEALKVQIEREGLCIARKVLGRQNNFTKTFGRYLEPSTANTLLRENHFTEINNFLRS
jgi:hypothetical protein